MEVPLGLFLGGAFVPSESGETFPVVDAAGGQPFVDVPSASEREYARALDVAVRVQDSWGETSPVERSELLMRLFELVKEHGEDLAALQSLELGRALPDSRGEVAYAAEYFRWFSAQALAVRGDYRTAPAGAGRIVTHHTPVGPVLAITPWNFPLAMIARKIGPALAAGCTCIVKPAKMTPLTALYLGGLIHEAGFPAGVVQILPTERAANASSLLDDARLRKLSFTGSTEVGQQLAASAMKTTKRVSLELGGNAPFVVLDHADVDKAVQGAVQAKMRGAGQVCVAANRFLVHESLAEQFTQGVVERMEKLVMGPGTQEGVDVGPMVSDDEREKVARIVERAIEQGAVVETGGPEALQNLKDDQPDLDPSGFWYPPTVLSGVRPEHDISRVEIFGPVLAVQTFSDTEEALRAANDTPFGLAGYVYGEKIAETMRVAERMEAGMVAVNRGVLSDAAAPFGGVKASGLGREGGFEGIGEYLDVRYLALEG